MCVWVDGWILKRRLYVPTDSQENPELIWNDEARDKVSDVVRTMAHKLAPAKLFVCVCVCVRVCLYVCVCVCVVCLLASGRFFEEQKSNPEVQWKVSDDSNCLSAITFQF